MSHKALSLLNIILTCAGFSYLHDNNIKLNKLKHYWQKVNLTPTIALIIGGIYFMANHKENLADFAEAITINVVCIMMLVDNICLLIYRDEIKEMVDSFILNEYEMKIPLVAFVMNEDVLAPKMAELKRLVLCTKATMYRIFTMFMVLMSCACFGSGVLFCISAIVVQFIQPDKYYRELPLPVQFPWDEKKTPYYQITFLMHIYFDAYIPCIYVGTDLLIGLLVGQLIRQLVIIRFIMSNQDELAAETSERGSQQWEMQCDNILANCSAYYTHLKRYGSRLNLILKPYFLAIAFCSGFVLCFAMFIIATAEELFVPRNITLFVLGFAAAVHIGLFCTLSQLLINESDHLRLSVVGNWWLHGRKHRSNIGIFQMAVLRPIKFYLFGTLDLSFPTYLSLIKASVSYFTILLTVTQEE